jgi:hypothetical protein
MVKIFKAKAKAEMKAMQVAGEGAAQDFLKGMWASIFWDGMVEGAGVIWLGWIEVLTGDNRPIEEESRRGSGGVGRGGRRLGAGEVGGVWEGVETLGWVLYLGWKGGQYTQECSGGGIGWLELMEDLTAGKMK